MTSSTPLPPHLERFVREQIAAGRFRSEGELIRAALQLLEASSLTDTPSGPRPKQTATGSTRQSERPPMTEKWEAPGEWLAGAPGKDTTPAPVRRSPRGLLADLRSGVSFDDIKDARSEMWSGLRHGGA